MVLFEPATLALVRGRTAVAAHIAAMTPRLRTLRGRRIERTGLRRETPPRHGRRTQGRCRGVGSQGNAPSCGRSTLDIRCRSDRSSRIPTFVITGAGAPMYGEIAAVLANEGAAHLVLEGTGHRPQDHPVLLDT
jgi:hypothetical protein